MNTRTTVALSLAIGIPLTAAGEPPATPPAEPASSSSLLVTVPAPPPDPTVKPHALRSVSLFAIAPGEARLFHEHDLIQIIVRETIESKSEQQLETEKDVKIKGAVTAWPDLAALLRNARFTQANPDDLPAVDVTFSKEFEGDGEYERRDDFTARLSAEVVEILPNGNLILESRSRWKQDAEEFTLKVTGICRPDDVTPGNTILSNQLHDLRIEKIHKGELREANKKGILTKVIETLFAF